MENITLPSTLKVISPNAFWECANLKTVMFANGLEKIGISAFQGSGV